MSLPRRLDIDTRKAVRKIQLWKMIGYDPEHGLLIFECPKTGNRVRHYGTTWAGMEYKDVFDVSYWGRDGKGEQVLKVKDSYEYIDPPKHEKPKSHANTCRCHLCLPYREMEE